MRKADVILDTLEDILDFKMGETVYLKTDPEQLPRMVAGVHINFNGLLYSLVSGEMTSAHYLEEISSEKTLF